MNIKEFYLNTYKKRVKPTQLLFQMATGSGKTLIMAGCILQLYKQGYRNFIFFVDSTNIIEKTKDNFLNSSSSKYLFNSQIQFDDKAVTLKQVENFANADADCINIHFTTIQGLHSRLNNPKENALTYEDFENRNVVLLSDEAHHMNVDTLKNAGKQLSIKEFEEYDSWEGTAMRIFRSSKENMLLEFTATAELHQEAIAKKYDDKLLYDNLNFNLPQAGIVGIIGPNGAGKTTMFKLITGQLEPDSGSFEVGETVKLAYVDQEHNQLMAEKSVFETVSDGNDWVMLGGKQSNARAYVSKFNFNGADQEKKIANLSGGERNRVHLAMMLKEGANVLLLDEPTNDLDVNTLRALEEGLENFAGCAVVISHDRWFLDRIATHILAFEGDSQVTYFEGNYSEYEEARKKRLGNDITPKRI
mgnify:CR=1 FL=1